jgi:hypothetical protein
VTAINIQLENMHPNTSSPGAVIDPELGFVVVVAVAKPPTEVAFVAAAALPVVVAVRAAVAKGGAPPQYISKY